jgi:hypothetical protein
MSEFCEVRAIMNSVLYFPVGHVDETSEGRVIRSRVGMFSAVWSLVLEFPFRPCVRRRGDIRRGSLDLAASKRHRVLSWSRLGADGGRS